MNTSIVHQLVNKDYDSIKMHGTLVSTKIHRPEIF